MYNNSMTPPKHLQALYAHAVDWCSERDVPLSWIRVWGRQIDTDSEMPIIWDQEGWGVVFTRALPPRHPLHQGPESTQARVWISASKSEFIERGLGQYRKDWDLNSGEQWSGMVLAIADVLTRHSYLSAAALSVIGNDAMHHYCQVCRHTEITVRGLVSSRGPCSFWINSVLDITAATMSERIPFVTR